MLFVVWECKYLKFILYIYGKHSISHGKYFNTQYYVTHDTISKFHRNWPFPWEHHTIETPMPKVLKINLSVSHFKSDDMQTNVICRYNNSTECVH